MRTWSVLIITLFFGASLQAQTITSEVSSDSILLGNYLIYEISMENIEGEIEFPSLKEFEVISGPNVSSSISIVNGKRSSSKTYTWHLKPFELGQYFIAPIAIELEGEVFESNPVEINVYSNPNGIIVEPQQKNRSNIFDFQGPSIFGQQPPFEPIENTKPKRELKKG